MFEMTVTLCVCILKQWIVSLEYDSNEPVWIHWMLQEGPLSARRLVTDS